ncbi:Hypothetical protein, putative [Bodo saltans]|uniref:Uncharacterized protein n=1 Tax=Bodo saltans TaxID=75058 RepID=A0A0S4JN64_BODSA|nr:Hypothetical protein, putative [Bodo saltans]|eukprot:CUG90839.1 Hypothetical protein, putative [Bodo saltans]
MIACRVEGLLRHGTHDRRRYNSEDFLNLCRDFVYEAPKEQHALVELSRRKVLSRTFQLIARICAASGHHAESQSAFEDSWAVSQQSSATCDVASLINYLSVCQEHKDAGRTLWLASDAVWLARRAVQTTIHEVEVLLRRGAPSEREAALARRREYGRMLVTAMVRQANSAMTLTRAQRASLRPTAYDEWRSHRTTLLFFALSRVAAEELDEQQDAQLHAMVQDSVDGWSRCLMLWGSSESPAHSMTPKDRWTYQAYQSRQYAAVNMDTEWRSAMNVNHTIDNSNGSMSAAFGRDDYADDSATPTLQMIEARYPFSLGIELVIVAGRGKSTFDLLPPPSKRASLSQNQEVVASTTAPQPPQRVASSARDDEFVNLDENYNHIGAPQHHLHHAPTVEGRGDATVPMPRVAMRSLRNVKQTIDTAPPNLQQEDTHAAAARRTQSSAALRAFTDRAFDLLHQYRLPIATTTTNVGSDDAAAKSTEDESLPAESRGPSPLPPPQPVAPIRQSHKNGHGIGPLSSVNSSSAQSISSSFLLHSEPLDVAPMPFVRAEESVSRDLFRAGTSVSPDPMPITLAIPIAAAPSPASALPRRRGAPGSGGR